MKNKFVRIGKSHNVWFVSKLIDNDKVAILFAASRKLDGSGYELSRYIPGRVGRKVVAVEKLTEV